MEQTSTAPRMADPLEPGQVCVVALSGGQASCWIALDAARLPGFNDPRIWEGLESWPEYFLRQSPEFTWGLEGAGLVLVDLDGKRLWSVPGSQPIDPVVAHLPSAQQPSLDDLLTEKAFNHLLARPDQWSACRLELAEVGASASIRNVSRRTPGTRQATLADILPRDASDQSARAQLLPHQGLLRWRDRRYRVASSRYAPKGWVVEGPSLSDPHLGLLQALRGAREAGFPAPDAESLDAAIARMGQGMAQTTRRRTYADFDAALKDWPEGNFAPAPRRRRRAKP